MRQKNINSKTGWRSLMLMLFVTLMLTGAVSQDATYSLSSILTGIADANKAGLDQDFLVEAVQKRGVDFRLTQEALQQLRQAGASNKLLIAIRDNCHGPQCNGAPPPTPTPTPKPTALQAGSEIQVFPNLRMVWIPPGRFRMGSDAGGANQKPVHEVEITKGFFLGKFEVTQLQWRVVVQLPKVNIDLNLDPSFFKGDNLPVEQISWDEAKEFIARLNARGGDYLYRLPTEAEWEYACRAGQSGDFTGNLDEIAWTGNNSGKQIVNSQEIYKADPRTYRKQLEDNGNQTHPIGKKKGNAWGLYDMLGNINEWCEDFFDSNYYSTSPLRDPKGPDANPQPQRPIRGIRGGGFDIPANLCTWAYRSAGQQSNSSKYTGFRLAAVVRARNN